MKRNGHSNGNGSRNGTPQATAAGAPPRPAVVAAFFILSRAEAEALYSALRNTWLPVEVEAIVRRMRSKLEKSDAP
jgi:hypothetical protein